jgi:hypothetical protein
MMGKVPIKIMASCFVDVSCRDADETAQHSKVQRAPNATAFSASRHDCCPSREPNRTLDKVHSIVAKA